MGDTKGILKAMFLAMIAALLGIGILGWQYRQIEKKRLPALQEQIEKQKQEIEEGLAQNVLDKFMLARLSRNESQATLYLTENAVWQKDQKEFILFNEFDGYEVLSSGKIGENQFRFVVKIYEEDEVGDFVEIITLIKVLDRYYVDSIEMAG